MKAAVSTTRGPPVGGSRRAGHGLTQLPLGGGHLGGGHFWARLPEAQRISTRLPEAQRTSRWAPPSEAPSTHICWLCIGAMLGTSLSQSHFTPRAAPQDRHLFYPHFTDREIEAQQHQGTCLRAIKWSCQNLPWAVSVRSLTGLTTGICCCAASQASLSSYGSGRWGQASASALTSTLGGPDTEDQPLRSVACRQIFRRPEKQPLSVGWESVYLEQGNQA